MNVELVNRNDLGDLDYYQNEYGWLLELNDDQLVNTVRMTNHVQNALIELFRFVDEVVNLPVISTEYPDSYDGLPKEFSEEWGG